MTEKELVFCSDIYYQVRDILKKPSKDIYKSSKIKKIREIVTSNLNQNPDISDSLRETLSGNNIEYIYSFLSEADKKLEKLYCEKKEQTDNILLEFDEDTQRKFKSFPFTMRGFMKDGKDVIIEVSSPCCNEKIILEDCETDFDSCSIFEVFEYNLSKSDDKYLLTVYLDNDEVHIKFSSAHSENDIKKPVDFEFYCYSPWSIIYFGASSVVDKYEISPSLLNEKEKDILPIMFFFNFLFSPFKTEKSDNRADNIEKGYHSFIALCKKFGFEEIISKKIDFFSGSYNKIDRQCARIGSELSDIKYKPLFDEIYSLLTDSQKDYPSEIELYSSKEELDAQRNKITEILYSHGYKGEYPEFYKDGKTKQTRNVMSYGVTYTVFKNSTARYFIRVSENYDVYEGNIIFNFICATHIKRKNEDFADNAISAMFRDKGHRFFSVVSNVYENFVSLDILTNAAVKKAELIKLSKEERKLLSETNHHIFLRLFLFVFVFTSVFFGVFFTLFIMLLSLIFVGRAGIEAIPWGQVGLVSGLSFGGISTLAMMFILIFNKKK